MFSPVAYVANVPQRRCGRVDAFDRSAGVVPSPPADSRLGLARGNTGRVSPLVSRSSPGRSIGIPPPPAGERKAQMKKKR